MCAVVERLTSAGTAGVAGAVGVCVSLVLVVWKFVHKGGILCVWSWCGLGDRRRYSVCGVTCGVEVCAQRGYSVWSWKAW